MKIEKEILTTGCDGHRNGDLSAENARHIRRVSHVSVASQNRALRHNRAYIYMYLVYTCNVFYWKKRIEGMLCPDLYLPVPVKFERHKCAPCSLVQRASCSSVPSKYKALGHNGNGLYIYLAYTCNVFLLKKRIQGSLHPVFHLPAPAGRSRLYDLYPCSLGRKTSHLDVTSRATALGHCGNNWHIYLVSASNVFYWKRK